MNRKKSGRNTKHRRQHRHVPDLRRRKLLATIGVVLALTVISFLDRRGLLLVDVSDLKHYNGRSFLVERVLDGDTLVIAEPDKSRNTRITVIRIWGIDAPEAARPFTDPPREAEPFSAEATEFLRQMVQGQEISLRLEPQRLRGNFGRLLAHVTLPDGRSAARELVKAGLARADDRWPHDDIATLDHLQITAKRKKIGIWSSK